jgi:hypothetical protein
MAVEALLGLALTSAAGLSISQQGFGEAGVAGKGDIVPTSRLENSSSSGRLFTKRGATRAR